VPEQANTESASAQGRASLKDGRKLRNGGARGYLDATVVERVGFIGLSPGGLALAEAGSGPLAMQAIRGTSRRWKGEGAAESIKLTCRAISLTARRRALKGSPVELERSYASPGKKQLFIIEAIAGG
jgi:hypothetical protein